MDTSAHLNRSFITSILLLLLHTIEGEEYETSEMHRFLPVVRASRRLVFGRSGGKHHADFVWIAASKNMLPKLNVLPKEK